MFMPFCFSQHMSLNQRLLVYVGYSTVKSNSFTYPNQAHTFGGENNSKFSVELGYKFNPSLSLSAYVANSQIRVNHFEIQPNNSIVGVATSMNKYFYGLSTRVHCLPLFFKVNNMRPDFYLIGTVGYVSGSSIELIAEEWKEVFEKPFYEYGAGTGLSYKFSKNIGVFGEFQLGNFYNAGKSQWKTGLLVTF